jgi:hypothetical protein
MAAAAAVSFVVMGDLLVAFAAQQSRVPKAIVFVN